MAAALVLLAAVAGIAGLVVSCSSLSDRPGDSRTAWLGSEPDIRVRIRKGTGQIKVEGPWGLRVSWNDLTRDTAGVLTIGCGVGGISVVDGAGGHFACGNGTEVFISHTGAGGPGANVAGTSAGGIVRLDGVDYPGTLLLRPRSEDAPEAFDVIAVMTIEDYLPGVVAHEMLARWPQAAYQVQAVCARTYALHDRQRARKTGRVFDVESTTLDQVFGGVSTNPAIVAAVTSTRGLAITWRGEPLRAYYSSTCGGRPGSAAEVWPTSAGFEFNLASPLQGGDRPTRCERSPAATWQLARPVEELARRIRAWGKYAGHPCKDLGTLHAIEIQESNSTGRPVKYALVDDRQRPCLTAEELRVACNWSLPGLAAITRSSRVNSSDFEVELRDGAALFRGRGLGHGVGMCQWCAEGLARDGMGWEAMIPEFYPGATIQKLY